MRERETGKEFIKIKINGECVCMLHLKVFYGGVHLKFCLELQHSKTLLFKLPVLSYGCLMQTATVTD